MLDALEIRKEIARLEYEEASYDNYAKLATLYTIRAEMAKPDMPEEQATPARVTARSYSADTVGTYGDSDFLRTVANKQPESAWTIMDELVESLRVMQPRTYEAVMREINSI